MNSRIQSMNRARGPLLRTLALSGVISLVWFGSSLAQQAKINANETFSALRDQVRTAHASGDGTAYVASSRKLEEFLHNSPSSLLQLMSAQTFAGDKDGALDSFESFIGMGQSDPNTLAGKPFDALRKLPRFDALQAKMAKNNDAIARGTEFFRMAQTDFLPEDVDYDAETSRFYVTSVLQKEIVSFDSQGHPKIFAHSPDAWPMMAIKIDARHRTVWATEVALPGFMWTPKPDWGRSAVLVYSLDSGRLLHRIEGPSKTTFGDMTLTHGGDAIVSDNDGGGVYRVSGKTFEVELLDGGEFTSPQTASVSDDDRVAFIPDYSRGIGILDLSTKKVEWLGSAGLHALNGIDGVYLHGTQLLATQNGTSPERVIVFALDTARKKVISESIIERATPTLGDPTHGVVKDGSFYYIADSGWDAIGDDGSIKEGFKSKSPHLVRVDLKTIQ